MRFSRASKAGRRQSVTPRGGEQGIAQPRRRPARPRERARRAESRYFRHCEEQSDEAIQNPFPTLDLLRGACHGRRFAPTRWLANDLRRRYLFAVRFLPVFLFFAAFFGTFFPSALASESPIAIACLRLLTLRPERPLCKVPALRFFIARPTLADALFEYFRAMKYSPGCGKIIFTPWESSAVRPRVSPPPSTGTRSPFRSGRIAGAPDRLRSSA